MSEVSEKLERLIVRHLDGDLTTEEAHDLNCELVRNQQARRLLEAYEKVDVLATEALEAAIAPGSTHEVISLPVSSTSSTPPVFRSKLRLALWFVPGAIAAALLAMVIPFPSLNAPTESIEYQASPLSNSSSKPGLYSPTRRVGDGQTQPVDWSRPKITRDRGKEVIGVRDEHGNLYWIEVDRTWLVRQPSRPLGEL